MVKINGLIFDIKRFAVHDGPGIRTTIFFKGCPLSCWWCHNPEGILKKQEIIYYDYKCINCGKCIDICSQNAIKKNNTTPARNHVLCKSCGKCVKICPTASQQLVGKQYSTEEIINEIKKDLIYFESSSGGVTFSGGEPLMQPIFLRDVLKQCKNKGIHTALDTSGYASKYILNSIINYVDLFLYDMKIINNNQHEKYTGMSNEIILKNLKTLESNKKNVILRFTVVKGITDTRENINNVLNLVSSLKKIYKIDLLTFHNVKEKYFRLGKEYKLNNIQSPTNDEINNIKDQFVQRGFNVKIGG
jgi:pyruvate formate lyase activating enzyme